MTGGRPTALERVYNRSMPTDESLKGLATVLDVVRRHGATTRTRLIDATGLSRAVVSQRVAELVEYGLLTEDGLGPSTGGRAPRRIRFRSEAAHLLVADLGATSIDVAVADLAGGILAHEEEPSDIAAGPEAVLDRVEQLFERCLAVSGTEAGDIWGIGIGVPGPVEFASGRPVAPPIMPGWDGHPIRERFGRYDVPVWVDNDVNVLALGELHAGVARGFENFVFVKIGTGIGAGIVVAGKLHRGAQGSAGDVGHIQIGDDDREVVCRCGNVNCLEAFAGGAALARDAEQAARDGRSPMLAKLLEQHGSLDARAIASAAAHGDSVSSELITGAGRRVGGMLAGIVNFFNPPLIVIGGGVARAGDTVLASIRESVYRRSLPLATRDLVVKRTSLEGIGGVVGAAAMVTDELFAPSGLEAWLEHGTPARTASGQS
jgi:glucokinase-like ROK family protein